MNELALAIFAVVLSITLGVTYWASKRTTTATEFWAAGRGISGPQNGFAIAGDYMSASSFLGFAGLIFFFGLDGFVGLVCALVAFVPVLMLLAERMRNAGKFTMADVLAFRLRERPARTAAALGTLSVAFFYLLAQMVGAGVVIQALAAAVRAVLAALQHGGSGDRRARGPGGVADPDRAQPGGVARPGWRGLAGAALEPGAVLVPDRLCVLLARHRAQPRGTDGAQLPRAARACGNRYRRLLIHNSRLTGFRAETGIGAY
jgi:hypothetical protein